MNPIFEAMSLSELRVYVLSHREDTAALHTLIDRRKAQGPRIQYPCPNTPENVEILRQVIQAKFGR